MDLSRLGPGLMVYTVIVVFAGVAVGHRTFVASARITYLRFVLMTLMVFVRGGHRPWAVRLAGC